MSRAILLLLLMAAAATLAACDDDDPVGPQPPFDLVFSGDASFNGPHGTQTIRVAVVSATGDLVDSDEGVVSATADPAFSFTFTGVLNGTDSYEIHYWIDSNFNGGATDACDPTANDHQWRVSVAPASDDVTVEEVHDPSEMEDVCSTFAAELVFEGDASFQAPHGGQPIAVAVVRSSDGAVIRTEAGTVSASADPAFSFTLPGTLFYGDAYEVHYWIDSNFGGGTAGTCDPMANDHQWSVDLGTIPADDDTFNHTETHDPSVMSAVCSTFD